VEFRKIEVKELPAPSGTRGFPTGEIRTSTTPGRVPAAGPDRRARTVRGESWRVEGDRLIKGDQVTGWVTFGDTNWTDYDLTFETRAGSGDRAVGAHVRCLGDSDNKFFVIIFDKNQYSVGHWSRSGGGQKVRTMPGGIQPDRWYKAKVSLRGSLLRVQLDGSPLFSLTDDFSRRGCVMLKCWNSDGQFRDIRVSAPDGTTLWEGPPDLTGGGG
jgi:hypothetical protein